MVETFRNTRHKDLKTKRIDIGKHRHSKKGTGSQSDSIRDKNPEFSC